MSKNITVDQAKELLWKEGVLDWKLTPPQKEIKKGILGDINKINVVLCARRLGKTYLMCTMAIEVCLQTPNAIVKYAFPKQNMAKRMLVPVMRKILDDCPKSLKPEYMVAEKCYRFPNGSEIQISGCDNGNIENLRGGDANLCIVDEAGFCQDLSYGIRSVLGPTTKTTKGRIIMVSTPSRSANHEFITDWVLPYQAESRIKVFTIYDNPQFNQEAIKEALSEYPEGDKDPSFRREYLCEIQRDNQKCILPSFNPENEKYIISDSYERPVYFTPYVGMDIGGSDLTAIVFGYYDYINATLVIEDEYVTDGSTNTKIVADKIKEIEAKLWTNPIDQTVVTPFLRVSDNNNHIFLTDLQNLHGLTFTKSKKDKREAAINALDVDLSQHKIVIHPRCEHLVYHMKFAEWNESKTKFKRLKDSPSGKIRGGHADCLAAVLYLHRSIVKSYNPYPSGFGQLSGANVFKSLVDNSNNSNGLAGVIGSIFKKK